MFSFFTLLKADLKESNPPLKILIVEPFMVESHKAWAEGIKDHSQYDIRIEGLNGNHWKWRMHGSAITLAKRVIEAAWRPDIFLCSDMLNVALFKSLLGEFGHGKKFVTYFHENQLTYPWSDRDTDKKVGGDLHYAFINYSSALVSDTVLFNSNFHKESFIGALPQFLKIYPDHKNLFSVSEIEEKSSVLSLGMDLKRIEKYRAEIRNEEKFNRALIIWNHRWEYDKNPEDFFSALRELKQRGVQFKLAVLGREYSSSPGVFEEAKVHFSEEIVHFGYAETDEEYCKWLLRADIAPVTSVQDFFGGSVVETIYADCFPLLPDRLAYPEHLPEAYRSTFFYKDQKDLVNRLQRLIFDVSVIRKQVTSPFVAYYDWTKQINDYDQKFLDINES